MTARAAERRRGLVAAALARAEAWLLEPPARDEAADGRDLVQDPKLRAVVAVIGLAPRCGTTTIARALAAELARRDPAGSAAVTAPARRASPALGTPAAARLARVLERSAPGRPRPAGRVCLVECVHLGPLAAVARTLAPLVLDLPHGSGPGLAAEIADHIVLVALPDLEPALAALVSASLGSSAGQPVTVVNRAVEAGRWHGHAALFMPESRLGARLVAGGEPRGPLAGAVARLADLCEAAP